MRLRIVVVAAALVAVAPSAAMAEYGCPPGYTPYGGVCQPIGNPGYSNPASGAVSGQAAGAASGYAAGGPVGAIVGGAIGTATGTVTGTANTLSGSSAPPACGVGYHWYNGYCYPNR
jgi:hypothetical protein